MLTWYGHEFVVDGPFKSLAAMKRANREAGGHYWDRAAVDLFDSRDESVHHGRFFIESRQFHGSDGTSLPREYAVRVVLDNGTVEHLSGVTHRTYAQARAELFAAVDVERHGAMPQDVGV